MDLPEKQYIIADKVISLGGKHPKCNVKGCTRLANTSTGKCLIHGLKLEK